MERKEHMVFGLHPVLECIKAGKEVDRILISKDIQVSQLAEILKTCKLRNIPVQKVPIEKLHRLTKKNHQGIIAFLSEIEYASLDNIIRQCFEQGETPMVLMLDRITDVRNFGAIARSAECMGVHAIVIPAKGAAQINSDAMKTSAGALQHIPVCRENNLRETARYLQQCGLSLVACTEKANVALDACDFTSPVCILMGSEEDGINSELLKIADHLVLIPMTGKIESLNVSVSAGIILYEASRQRRV
ncbi:MAG: 23S rRNA (guanosine(2251)-2'-O)-methyltransferase RlmB [Cytophagaceae bacterium]|nr:23S rRNA (guanosine(2251)-2'-O)-methyltransferase RlmB [Cytophagaceae bacterium]